MPESEESKPEKKLIGFAKTRAEDEELKQLHTEMLASVEPRLIVAVDDKLPLPVLPDREAIYATLRGERKLTI